MASDPLYYAVSEVLKKVLAKEQSLRNAVYSSTYKSHPTGAFHSSEGRMGGDAVSPPTANADAQEEPKCNPFGTRYLIDETRVWDYNAWDNVCWSEEMELHARQVVKAQREQGSTIRVLEVGCGVGNTSYPLLEWDKYHRMFLYSCDFSAVAVDVLKKNKNYDQSRICGFVWDITEDPPEDAPEDNSLDYVICIYVISAIYPPKVRKAIDNLVRLLKPGGMLLFKDYGRFDLTQLRFKENRYIGENLYCRGDGTLVYFFSKDELDQLLLSAGLVRKVNVVDKRLIVNRAKQIKMYRHCETLRFRFLFDDLLKDSELARIPSDAVLNGDINLTYVLLYEFLIGAVSAAVTSLHTYNGNQEKSLAEIGRGVAAIKKSSEQKGFAGVIPRYARINTLKWSTKEVIERLLYEEWKVISLSPEDNFVERVSDMAADEVFVDPHIENLLIFSHSNEFHRHWLASCLPAYLLSPSPNSHVLDVCAAPGMKTSHVAAILGGTGKIWAIDRSADRVETMEQMLKECNVENVSIFHGDFLKVDVNDKKFSKVRYAVVDPPCSGSGMVKRMDELTGGNASPERLSKLKNLQVLSDMYVRQNFRLASRVLPSWRFRGLDTYEFGSDCLRADPAETLTNGFFVAVFERIVGKNVTDMRKTRNRRYKKCFEKSGEAVGTRKRKVVVRKNSDEDVLTIESACKKKKKRGKQSLIKNKD
uniref:SAM_MT_RSMB_NOP domain-containing protein n=1 Tax=Angiostrongylus cantonensis TaxID=6313 RepID=A0A158PAE6_ANGCA